jgi:predicted secreted protein
MNMNHCIKAFLCIPVFCLSMLLIGCDSNQSSPSSLSLSSESFTLPSAESPSAESCVIISNVDNGSSKQMKVGETFEVTLQEDSTSEIRWKVDEVNSSILYEVAEGYDEEYDYDPLRYSLTCVGKTTMRFAAIRPGQTPLRLVHRQPEKIGDLTIDSTFGTFEINVVIKDR